MRSHVRNTPLGLVPDFLLDKLSASAENWDSGDLVLAMVVGAVIALIVFGLPLAIIGLFIASILDRRNKRVTDDHQKSLLAGLRRTFPVGRSFPIDRLRHNDSVDGRHKS
jgi:hypothetical protein